MVSGLAGGTFKTSADLDDPSQREGKCAPPGERQQRRDHLFRERGVDLGHRKRVGWWPVLRRWNQPFLMRSFCWIAWRLILVSDKGLSIWDPGTNTIQSQVFPNADQIEQITLSPDGKWLLGWGDDKIALWNARDAGVPRHNPGVEPVSLGHTVLRKHRQLRGHDRHEAGRSESGMLPPATRSPQPSLILMPRSKFRLRRR